VDEGVICVFECLGEGFGCGRSSFLMGFEEVVIVEKYMPSFGVLSGIGSKVLA
jgi:hypothetical protein